MKIMHPISFYQKQFVAYLETRNGVQEPKNLYEPIQYILGLGGKRLRPVLTLMAADLFGGSYNDALDAATAVEVFHNFSLVHDDIMDDAPLRRGYPTVHEKWDINTGILSGDAMLINSYQFFENYEDIIFGQLVRLFSKTAIQVCEGQQYDIDFETRNNVTIPEYLKMIEYKTAVLVACALKMGAIVANASPDDQEQIYEFGRNLGIAFQIQDDYLDAFGDPETFGKQLGGDIIENKKTFLYLKALEKGNEEENKQLLDLFSIRPKDPEEKITAVREVFESTGAVDETSEAIGAYTLKAFAALDKIDVSQERKAILVEFGNYLMKRKT